MTRKYFGTDGIRGTVGQPPITPDFVLRLAACGGPRAEAHRGASHRADRQGHPHIGLHAGERAGIGFQLRGRRCGAAGPRADASRGLSHPRAARQPGRGHQCAATIPFRTMASSSSARRAPSCPTTGSVPSKRRWRRRRSGWIRPAWARRAAWTTRPAATSSSARAPSPATSRSKV
jgi:hypothetical protein